MSEVRIYAIGLCCASVCVPEGMQREVIEAEVNRMHPAGGELRWEISKDATFADGKTAMPAPCNDTAGRRHYLLNC